MKAQSSNGFGTGWGCFLVAAILILLGSGLFAQNQTISGTPRFESVPLHGNTLDNALIESGSGVTVPLFNHYTRSSRDGHLYATTIMGKGFDPSQFTHQSTTIPVVLIPLVVTITTSDGTHHVFDPTQTAYGPPPSCSSVGVPVTLTQNSPLFQDVPYTWNGTNIGTTQYIDAFQRGEFWNGLGILECTNDGSVGNQDVQTGGGTVCFRGGTVDWHTRFSVTTTAPQYFYPSAGGVGSSACAEIGEVDYSELRSYVENTLLPSLPASPTTLPVILMENVFAATNSFTNCCILGFHGAYNSPMQVYAVAEFDTRNVFGPTTADVSDLSHELAEAVNDPTVLNPTPAWGHVGQVTGCQNNLEVGDPLTGTLMPAITLGGFAYHLQELAFYSWFMGSTDGLPGWYSSNGTFTANAGAICH